MKTNNFEPAIIQIIRQRVSDAKMAFFEKINMEIEASKRREEEAITNENKQFHRGVHIGMTHTLILFGEIEI